MMGHTIKDLGKTLKEAKKDQTSKEEYYDDDF